ncbi:MAG: GAF domain-containing protein [Burkholderiales bacterium]|nr:GAF domain-containing protein [Anaerolineae bacterium]
MSTNNDTDQTSSTNQPTLSDVSALLRRQADTSAALAYCATFPEMASAIASHMLAGNGQFISIGLLDYEDDKPRTLRIVASANRQQAFESGQGDSDTVTLTADEISHLTGSTTAPLSLLFADIQSDSRLSDTMRSWLAGHQVMGMASLLLRRGARTFGILNINDNAGQLTLSEPEFLAYQSIAYQVSALAEVYRLTEESGFAQDISERLARAFSELNADQDYAEMADVIARQMLPQPGRSLRITALDYDASGAVSRLQTLASANREAAYTLDETLPNWNELGPQVRQAIENGAVLVVNDVLNEPVANIGEALQQWFRENDVKSLLNVPLTVDSKPIAIMSIVSRTKTTFTTEEVNAFRNLGDQIGALIQARGLLRQTTDALNRAQMQYDVTGIIHTNPDAVKILGALYKFSGRAYAQAQFVLVTESTESSGEAANGRIVAVAGGDMSGDSDGDGARPADEVIALSEFPAASALPALDVLDVQDVANDLFLEEEERERLLQRGVRAMVIVPMVANQQLVGLLAFTHPQPIKTDVNLLRTIRSLADQTAVVFKNQSLLREAQQRAEQLQRVTTFSQSVQASLDLPTILETAMTESAQVLMLNRIQITMLDEVQDVIRPVARYENGQTWVDLNNAPALDPKGTMMGQVWETQTFMYVADTGVGESWDSFEVNVRSLMIAPLLARGRVMGTVSVGHARPFQYTDTDTAIFQQMINQLTVALENARVFINSQRQAENQALVNDIAARLQQQPDIESMLNITITELGQAIGARRGRIRLRAQQPENGGHPDEM